MDKIIDYYFSPSSPWTYLGHARFTALAARHGARINVKPADFAGAVFPATGGLPLAQRPKPRQDYRLAELRRWSSYLGLPLNLHPRYFPVAADAAARMIIAADLKHGTAAALDLAGRVMATVWVKEGDIADANSLAALAAQARLGGTALLQRAEHEDVRNRYARNTEEAVARGVFGAPFYIYRDEPFWGQDRLDFLDRALARE
ncbi:MAG: 2-hydroxychromene-2-carboxylate isomerase [Burkholderiales bacterium]|nr:2-hydroxychromene-2-carboxylate isomerase [Burkholderiales bacterium]